MTGTTPPPRDPTQPPKWPVRAGLAVATFVYCLYSSFGIAAPFWWGHHGYHGATYMLRARMSLRLHMLSPATWGGFETPPKEALYFHHPIGYHHLLTLLVPIFGEKEWLARGVAVAGGLFTMWALYALVRRMWSREIGLCEAEPLELEERVRARAVAEWIEVGDQVTEIPVGVDEVGDP